MTILKTRQFKGVKIKIKTSKPKVTGNIRRGTHKLCFLGINRKTFDSFILWNNCIIKSAEFYFTGYVKIFLGISPSLNMAAEYKYDSPDA